MAEPFVGEIRLVSFGFPPKGWAACNGQLLPINQNQALFSLLGTTYGGDGRVNFALPDLRGRMPMHRTTSLAYSMGQRAGEEAHTLSTAEIPAHSHTVGTQVRPGKLPSPAGAIFASQRGGFSDTGGVAMHAGTVGIAGGSQAHQNMPPYLTITLCIALVGIFPSQN